MTSVSEDVTNQTSPSISINTTYDDKSPSSFVRQKIPSEMPERFKCFLCCYRNYDKEKLLPHMMLHSASHQSKDTDSALCCTLCPYNTNSFQCLQAHLICHDSETSLRVFSCQHCHLIGDDIEFIDRHLKSAHSQLEYHIMVSKLIYIPGQCVWCSDAVEAHMYLDHLLVKHRDMYSLAELEGAIPPVTEEQLANCDETTAPRYHIHTNICANQNLDNTLDPIFTCHPYLYVLYCNEYFFVQEFASVSI